MSSVDLDRVTERAIGGDPEAMERLWDEHRRWVAAILLAHKPHDAELDDLLQDVAMTLVRNISTLNDPSQVRSWLRTVAVNAARLAGRKRKVRLRLVRPMEQEAELPAPSDNAREEAVALGKRALELAQGLGPDLAEPLLMRCLHRMTYRQIAQALGEPVTTIESRLARARRELRERLTEETEPRAHAASG